MLLPSSSRGVMSALSPAELLGLSKDCGSIAEGKAADLVVWSGDPLSLIHEVELVVVDGRITWQKEKP